MQAGVGSAHPEQFFMGSLFNDACITQHNNPLSFSDGGQPVGNNKVVRFLASPSRESCTTRSLSLSRALVASSKMSTGGFFRKTRAILIKEHRVVLPTPEVPTTANIFPSLH